jgi:hypothetical protein
LRRELKTILDKLNRALTALAASMASVHAPAPEQLPDQLVKSEPVAGVAVNVTLLPTFSEAEQLEPQSIRAGCVEVTRPEPLPVRLTESGYLVPPQAISAEARSKGEARCERKKINWHAQAGDERRWLPSQPPQRRTLERSFTQSAASE